MASPESQAKDLTRALLIARGAEATVCPSEVARQLATARGQSNWRALMPTVHAAIDALVADAEVRLSWKGAPLASRAGPYRIGRAGIIQPRCG
jgi:hypothetical protein